ncbi:glycoside hydrolase family 127 protein [Olivibacter sp. SDN3]|uniref:glycoside hydrolase family 127 protein n=1 Tax=Olivibacter sp. SDN3 TaxID=2764720 RepID=UPI001651508F|nr:glycoside hydrolase family 127 protein [Olivibacter sp. SDN3]QNL50743.1 glycoside hydrolase family 127 protein [Olivibacter sp. SDN3]
MSKKSQLVAQKSLATLLLLLLFSLKAIKLAAQTSEIELFPLANIRLLGGPFQAAQQTDLRYLLELNPDRLLAPYLREAGLTPKAPSYGNWEDTGLDGHIGGHYLSALALMVAANDNTEAKNCLAYMLGELQRCQQRDPDGYVGGIPEGKEMWEEIKAGKIKAESFALNGKWVPIYNIHKLFSGLIDVYILTGNEQAKNILMPLADWWFDVFDPLTDDQIQQVLVSEHGGMNEVFVDVAAITNDKKYLRMAERLSHHAILDPLRKQQDKLTGLHANTQIPKVIGFEKVASAMKKTDWERASTFFWETVVQNRSVSIGGNSEREHFHAADNFQRMLTSREGPETCNTYNMMKLSRNLFLRSGERKFIDYYERAVFNHILSSQHPEMGGFVYFTPMRPNHYRVYSQPQEGFWCCVGSGLESHGKYGELIYAHRKADLFVNLFMASTLDWREQGIRVRQETAFPYEQQTTIEIQTNKKQDFAVHIRKPIWLEAVDIHLTLDDKRVNYEEKDGFLVIRQAWKKGSSFIKMALPMTIKEEFLPSGEPWVSFSYGPIVLGAKQGKEGLKGLFADDKRMAHIASGTLLPLRDNPVMLAADQQVSSAVSIKDPDKLLFELHQLKREEEDVTMTLQPFYTIHDSRYTLYWRVADASTLDSLVASNRRLDSLQLLLDNNTVDAVIMGEQQPESDHHIQHEEAYTGVDEDAHWRASKAWFAYELKNSKNKAGKIWVKQERTSDACYELWVNDLLVKPVDELLVDEQFKLLIYSLEGDDHAKLAADRLLVTFKACNDRGTGKLFEVRLLKE